MSELMSNRFSRRAVLLAVAGAAPLLAAGAKSAGRRTAANGGRLPGLAQGRPSVRSMQLLRRAECV